jgi:hypothetical protein
MLVVKRVNRESSQSRVVSQSVSQESEKIFMS